MAFIKACKTKSGTYFKVVEKYRDENGRPKVRHLKYLGKDPRPYLEEVAKGKAALAVKQEYPDLALKSGQAAMQEHRRRKLPKAMNLEVEEKLDVVYADPPWQYDNSGLGGSAENHYPTQSLEWIKARRVKNIIGPNAILFLWATNPFLSDALDVMREWGFEYKTNMVWVKNKSTYGKLGFYVYGRHELLLIGVAGSMLPEGEKPTSVLDEELQRHSRKPGKVYEIIETMYPNKKKGELFCREARPGWVSIGNEVE